MYNKYFGFRENPFSIAPDPRYLYLSEMHQDGLAHLHYGLSDEGCITLLTGEVGTGKTTLCRFFLEQLEPTAKVALIINPGLSASELLAAVCDEFQVALKNESNTTKQHLDTLNQFLLQTHSENSQALLVIDEAQNLDKEALEMVRLLTNLETDRQKLLKIILLGQSELSAVLTSPDLTQVSQRITARYHLKGLELNETARYVRHRLNVAGGGQAQFFSNKAVKRIHQITGGIPRLINSLCDRSLIGAYSEEKKKADETIVKRAARELFGFDHASKTIEIPISSLAIAALAILVIVFTWAGSTSDIFHLDLGSILTPQREDVLPLAGSTEREKEDRQPPLGGGHNSPASALEDNRGYRESEPPIIPTQTDKAKKIVSTITTVDGAERLSGQQLNANGPEETPSIGGRDVATKIVIKTIEISE